MAAVSVTKDDKCLKHHQKRMCLRLPSQPLLSKCPCQHLGLTNGHNCSYFSPPHYLEVVQRQYSPRNSCKMSSEFDKQLRHLKDVTTRKICGSDERPEDRSSDTKTPPSAMSNPKKRQILDATKNKREASEREAHRDR